MVLDQAGNDGAARIAFWDRLLERLRAEVGRQGVGGVWEWGEGECHAIDRTQADLESKRLLEVVEVDRRSP